VRHPTSLGASASVVRYSHIESILSSRKHT
jgi:hypothetical protein